MKRWFAVLAIVVIAGLVFSVAQVSASSGYSSGEDQPVVLKKTPQPKTNPGLEKKAEKQAEKELRQAEKELRKAEKEAERAEKKAGKKVHFRGVVSEVGDASFVLDVGGTMITFMVDEKTQIKIPTLGNDAELSMLNVGVKASVQAVELLAPETPPEGESAVQQEQEPNGYLALKVQVIPGKPERIHRVGVVVNYQPGMSITIQAKDMQLYTFLLTETTKILPKDRVDELAVGVWVTIISRRDPTGDPLTAQGIVVHPKTEEGVSEPTDITLTGSTVAENSAADTLVGVFTTTDTTGDTFTYTLVAGTGDTHNALFKITGDQLLVNGVIDFETTPTLSIRVRSTDQNGSFFEKVFTITVTNVNEAPTDIALTILPLPEDTAVGTVVGTFTTTDPDVGDTFTYELVTGTGDTNNAWFTVATDTLVLAQPLDFETLPSLSIRVKVTDLGSLFFEKVFTITVTDIAEP